MPDTAGHRLVHAERLPTLTEVVEIGVAWPAPPHQPVQAERQPERQPVAQPIDQALLVQQVLAEIMPYLDERFELHLRAALAPALARAVGGALTEGRVALARSLRELVDNAVTRALTQKKTDRGAEPS